MHDSDPGVQYLAIVYTDRPADAGALTSVGSKGDSFDNALAESVNGLFKTESIAKRGPVADRRRRRARHRLVGPLVQRDQIHSACDDVPPAEFEANYYRHKNEADEVAQTQSPESLPNPGRFKPSSAPRAG